ncbi:MAG: serine/threonine-protein kinase [Gemmatimonadaceae bacterium]
MFDRDFIDLQQALAGDYSLERELGRGGMGIVYLAREVQLDRLVAIKVLPGAFAARADVRERFLREARMAASLSHPHIVPIYRVGEAGGFVFFAMAYVNGETLGERLRTRGPLAAPVAARLLREIAWALSYAHGRGIVHRDIKPDNILIEAETGRALVSDFGIARGAEDTALSDPGRVMGTAHFMSPEQASNEALDGRSDFYSLGVVAYLAVSGKLPFDASNSAALALQHLGAPVPSLSAAVPSAPRPLVTVIERCLRKSPDERFPSGEALAEALDAATTPLRAKLPIALRVWTQAQDPLRGLYVAWSSVFTMGLMSELMGYHRDWPVVLAFDLLPLVPITLFHARKTYQALSTGYTLRDLRAALAAWRQERREELTFEYDVAEFKWARALRVATYALVGTSLVLLAAGGPVKTGRIVMSWVFALTFGGSLVALLTGNALGVRLIGRSVRSKLVGAVRSLIWNSRVGEWAAKLLTPRNRKAIADLDYRPTEMALSVAASDLYAKLPREYREHLQDLPLVVERLEAHAAAARARVDELNALVGLGSNERSSAALGSVVAARDAAKRELAESVAALEAVRLDLLRLHGGSVDLQPITTVLEAARELGDQLDRLQQAQREVDTVVRPLPIDLEPHTPI